MAMLIMVNQKDTRAFCAARLSFSLIVKSYFILTQLSHSSVLGFGLIYNLGIYELDTMCARTDSASSCILLAIIALQNIFCLYILMFLQSPCVIICNNNFMSKYKTYVTVIVRLVVFYYLSQRSDFFIFLTYFIFYIFLVTKNKLMVLYYSIMFIFIFRHSINFFFLWNILFLDMN